MIGWYGGHMYSALKCSQEGSASNPGPSSSPVLSSVTLNYCSSSHHPGVQTSDSQQQRKLDKFPRGEGGREGEGKDYKQPAID